MPRQSAQGHVWVGRDETLAEVCGRIEPQAAVGLDIEFMRVDSYFPKACLYQLLVREEVFLIDALAVREFEPLTRLLTSQSNTKVLHATGEDLEVIRTHLGITPCNVFDSQVAAAIVGYGWSIGYAPLVQQVLGVVLKKEARRSDWSVRPLSNAQIDYAVRDVAHLLELHRLLSGELDACGRYGWLREELSREFEREAVDPCSYYLKIRGAGGLEPRQLAVLRALCDWREREAMRRDLPRQWVVRDEHLLRFSRTETLDAESLANQLPRQVARRYGPGLLRAFDAGRQAQELPEPLRSDLNRTDRKRVKLIMAEVGELATRLRVPPELLAKKREIQHCVQTWQVGSPLPDYLNGWRRPFLEPVLTRCIEL